MTDKEEDTSPIERSRATISDRVLMKECDYNSIVACFRSYDNKMPIPDIEVSRQNFYGLQLLLRAVLGQLGRYNKDPNAGCFHRNRYVPFKGDGVDGLRTLREIVDNFTRGSCKFPAVVQPLSSESHDWSVLIRSGANEMESIPALVEKLALGSRTVLKFAPVGRRKGSSRGRIKALATWKDDPGIGAVLEDQLCNAFLKHHVDEIELFCEHDPNLIYPGDSDIKSKRELHNTSLRRGSRTFGVTYEVGSETPCLDKEIPAFWEKWQSKARRLENGWGGSSAAAQFEILWEKIMGEYLGCPERKPFNVVFEQQVDLRPLGMSGLLHLLQTKDKGCIPGKRSAKGRREYMREVLADKHATKTFRGIIKRYIKRRFMALTSG